MTEVSLSLEFRAHPALPPGEEAGRASRAARRCQGPAPRPGDDLPVGRGGRAAGTIRPRRAIPRGADWPATRSGETSMHTPAIRPPRLACSLVVGLVAALAAASPAQHTLLLVPDKTATAGGGTTVLETFRTGRSFVRVPCFPDLQVGSEKKSMRFEISTEKMGGAVLLRIDDVRDQEEAVSAGEPDCLQERDCTRDEGR